MNRLLLLLLPGFALAAATSFATAQAARVDPNIFDGTRRPKAEAHPALEAAAQRGAVARPGTPGGAGSPPADPAPGGGRAPAAAGARPAAVPPAGAPADAAGPRAEGAEPEARAAAAEGLPEAPPPVRIGDPAAMVRGVLASAPGGTAPIGVRPDPAARDPATDPLDPLTLPGGGQNTNTTSGGTDRGGTVPPHL